MSQDDLGGSTRRAFLGSATAATALTVVSSAGAEQAPMAGATPDPTRMAQLKTGATAPSAAVAPTSDWTKPAAMAIPKEGYFQLEQGRYGPVYPRTPACYGFTVIAKVKEGREEALRQYGKEIEAAVAADPDVRKTLRLHYLRWVPFEFG